MLTIIPQLPNLGGANLTNLLSKKFHVPGPLTGNSHQSGNGAVNLMCKGGTTGQYLIIEGQTTAPYIKADLYDSTTNSTTALTISGSISYQIGNGYGALIYSTEQSKWYLMTGGTTQQYVFPLTLSGTTLTIGSGLNVDAQFSSTGIDSLLMAGDNTDLYILDIEDGSFYRYDLSAGAFGSALTAPPAGYYAGNVKNSYFTGSNGKIYLVSSDTLDKQVNYFYEYDISGDSWTRLTVPQDLQNNTYLCSLLADPDDNSLLYFFAGGGSSTYGDIPRLIKYTRSTDTGEQIVQAMAANGAAAWNHQLSSTQMIYLGNSAEWKRCVALDISNDDIILGHIGSKISNFGDNWQRQTVFSYTGSGQLLGLQDLALAYDGSYNSLIANANTVFYVTIDGGAEQKIDLGAMYPGKLYNDIVLPFSTSISIDAISGAPGGYNYPGYTIATILLNIIS